MPFRKIKGHELASRDLQLGPHLGAPTRGV